MIAVYDPITGEYEIVNSITNIDMAGKVAHPTPQGFDPVNVSHRLIGGVWVENNDPPPLDISRLRPIQVPFHSDGGATITLTNLAAAAQFFTNSNRVIEKMDLSLFTQARLTARVLVAGTANSILAARWSATFTTTIGSFEQLGVTEVAASLAAVGVADSGWIDIAEAALIDNAFLTIRQSGGDGAADPQIGRVSLWLR
jgi:hypothetical protein